MLALSILALLAGPLLFRLFQGSRESSAALDGFVRISLAGLLLVHVLPQSLGLFGWPAAGIFLAGAVLPMLAHGLFRAQGPRTLNLEVSLGLAGLALHTFLDGVALHPIEGSPEGDSLAFAVVLHRLPVGLAVWWLVRPRVKAAVAVFALIVLSTLLGESFGGSFLEESTRWMSAFQAFMAGALLHVVVGHSFQLSRTLTRKSEKIASGLGGLLAIGLLLVASHESGSAGRAFLQLAGESAPALLAASVTVALAKAFLPIQLVNFFRGGGRFSQALRGTVAGLPVPICSCGVIPMYRGLIEAGTPRSAAIAFLIASPEIGWASMLLSLSLLGGPMTFLRVAGAALLALVLGMALGGNRGDPPLQTLEEEGGPREPWKKRLRGGIAYGFGDLVDATAPWILLGLGVAAVAGPLLAEAAWLTSLPTGLDVVAAAIVGMPIYVCASGSTPLIAVLLAAGLSPGAAIAFLLTGPATNLTTFGVLKDLHGGRLALAFSAGMPFLAVGLGLAANSFLPDMTFPPLDSLGMSMDGPLGWSLLILGGVYFASLLRQGVTGFLGQVFTPLGGDEDPHACCEEGE